jgi:ADP-heptose:LPS heptosyltransferase
VHLISLQKGAGEAEAAQPPAGLSLIDLGSRIGDFADAAAIVACLDLVICVDTAIAHLAGALGKPCWVLLPHYKTDWRWLTGRTDSPWYPDAMRLFRQAETGNWDDVIAEVVVALERFVGARRDSMPVATAPGAAIPR